MCKLQKRKSGMEVSRHSARFFRALLEGVQRACREHIVCQDHIDVSGYLALEIDNLRKERYVISELIHAAGSMMSESYCTKVFNTTPALPVMPQPAASAHPNPLHSEPGSPPLLPAAPSLGEPSVEVKFELQEVADHEVEFKLESCDVTSEITANRQTFSAMRQHRGSGATAKGLTARRFKASSSTSSCDKKFSSTSGSLAGRAAELVHLQALHDSIVKDAGRSKQARTADSLGHHVTVTSACSGAVTASPAGFELSAESGSLLQGDDITPVTRDVMEGVRNLQEAVPVGQPWSVSKTRPDGSQGKRAVECELQSGLAKRARSNARENPGIGSPSSPADSSMLALPSSSGNDADGFDEDDTADCIIVSESPEQQQQRHHHNRLQQDGLAQVQVYQNHAAIARLDSSTLIDLDSSALGNRSVLPMTTLASKHTLRKTRGHMQQFQRFLCHHGDTRPMATIPPNELDPLLGAFFSQLRKDDGEEYDPGYVRNIQSSLERYLRFKGYAWSIVRDPEFAGSRAELKSKQERLFSQGRPDWPSALTSRDVDMFFERGQLGTCSPESVLNTMWFMVNLYFGPKGVREHSNMVWGDIVLDRDESGGEYLRYTALSGSSDLSRTRIRVLANPTNQSRCYVQSYKRYRDLRPPSTFHPSSPFYLAVNQFGEDSTGSGAYHFRATALSTYRLVGIIRRMSMACNMADRKLSNVSFNSFVMQLHDKGLLPSAAIEPSGLSPSVEG